MTLQIYAGPFKLQVPYNLLNMCFFDFAALILIIPIQN